MTGAEVARGLQIDALLEQVTDTPRVVIDRAIVAANVRRMQEHAGVAGMALRPHVKTHKMPEIARLQVDAGAAGIQVAKLGEAEVMADAGIRDILVAYPIVGAEKLRRLAALAERVAISLSLDSLEVATGISRALAESGARVGILLEIDTGLHRIGVAPADGVDLAARIADLPLLDFRGFMTHEGHVYTAAQNEDEMRRLTHEACRAVVGLAAAAHARGLAAPIISVGASGTARFDFEVPGVTEVRPGTYVFNDLTQIELGAAGQEDIAACVIATVVSRPAADRAVVDSGTKTLSSDQRIVPIPTRTFGRLAGPNATSAIWVARASEEHGVLGLTRDVDLRVGDRVAIIPNHICAVINLHDEVLVADGPRLVDRWQVAARGRLQ